MIFRVRNISNCPLLQVYDEIQCTLFDLEFQEDAVQPDDGMLLPLDSMLGNGVQPNEPTWGLEAQ